MEKDGGESDWDFCDIEPVKVVIQPSTSKSISSPPPPPKTNSKITPEPKTKKSDLSSPAKESRKWEEEEDATPITLHENPDLIEIALSTMNFSTHDPSLLPKSFRLALSNRFSIPQLLTLTTTIQHTWQPSTISPHTKPLPYFFCGSLMFPQLLRSIIPSKPSLAALAAAMTPATLPGYTRHRVHGVDWPAILPSSPNSPHQNRSTKGMLVFRISSSADTRDAIHRFEGGLFELRAAPVQVELADGSETEIMANVYVWGKNVIDDSLVPISDGGYDPAVLLRSEWFRRCARAGREDELL